MSRILSLFNKSARANPPAHTAKSPVTAPHKAQPNGQAKTLSISYSPLTARRDTNIRERKIREEKPYRSAGANTPQQKQKIARHRLEHARDEFLASAKNGILSRSQTRPTILKLDQQKYLTQKDQQKLHATVSRNLKTLQQKKREFNQAILELKKTDPNGKETQTIITAMKKEIATAEATIRKECTAFNSMSQTFQHNEQFFHDMNRIGQLLQKANKKGKLSGKEHTELNRLVWTHKEAIPILQNHTTKMIADLNSDHPITFLAKAVAVNTQYTHTLLESCLGQYTTDLEKPPEHLDPHPILSRVDRVNFHLLEVDAACQTVENLKKNYLQTQPQHHARLDQMRKELMTYRKNLTLLKQGTLPRKVENLEPLLTMPAGTKKEMSSAERKAFGEQIARQGHLPIAQKDIDPRDIVRSYMTHHLNAMSTKQKLPDAEFLQEQARADILNQSPWKPIHKKLTLPVGDKEKSYRSNIVPAGALSKKLEQPYTKNGVSASDRMQYRHAVNLAQTSLQNTEGKTLFSAHRSGVLDAYKMTPANLAKLPDPQLQKMMQELLINRESLFSQRTAPSLLNEFRNSPKTAKTIAQTMRQESARAMAEDTAATMILNNPEKLKQAMKGETVNLNITSLSLMTPDHIRGIKGGNSEKAMLAYHANALKSLENRDPEGNPTPITLKIRDSQGELKTISVKVRARAVNFGVNAGALRTFGKLPGNIFPPWRKLMGWGLASKMNNPVLEDLIGKKNQTGLGGQAANKIRQLNHERDQINTDLQENKINPTEATQQLLRINTEIRKISQMAHQIKDLWKSGKYLSQGNDPYKMPARIALLSEAVGEEVLFHCKSGKDRSGQLDVEMKYLAATQDATGSVPKPDRKPNRDSRLVRSHFALVSGNTQLQQYNTGLPGFKVKMPALAKSFDPRYKAAYHGGSALISS